MGFHQTWGATSGDDSDSYGNLIKTRTEMFEWSEFKAF